MYMVSLEVQVKLLQRADLCLKKTETIESKARLERHVESPNF